MPEENQVMQMDPTYGLTATEKELYEALQTYDPTIHDELPENKLAMDIIGLAYNAQTQDVDVKMSIEELNETTIFGKHQYKHYLNIGFVKPCLPMAMLNASGNATEYLQLLKSLNFDQLTGLDIQQQLDTTSDETELDEFIQTTKRTIRRIDPSILYQLDTKSSCPIFKSCPFIKSKTLKPHLIGRSCLFYLTKCLKYYVENKVKYTKYFQALNQVQDIGIMNIVTDLSRQIAMLLAENEIIISTRVAGGVEQSEEFTREGVIISNVADPTNKIYNDNIKQIENLEKKTGIDHSKLLDFSLRVGLMQKQQEIKANTGVGERAIVIQSGPTPLKNEISDLFHSESKTPAIITAEIVSDTNVKPPDVSNLIPENGL